MTLNDFKPLMNWLHANPHWGGFIAFIFAFAESLVIIGLFVPGSLIMTAIGILIGSGVLPLGSTMLWAIVGAMAGDFISFWLGYRYKEQLRSMWPFRNLPHWLDKGEVFFIKHGGKGIIAGRFIGPIRPILPVAAGMLKMSPLRFIFIEIISALLWAPAYMLPGVIIGAASLALSPETSTKLIIYLLAALFFIWLSYWLIKKIVLLFVDYLDRGFKKLWIGIQGQSRYRPLYQILHAAHIPEDHSQLVRAVFGLITLIAFILLTFLVASENNFIAHLDYAAFHLFRSLYNISVLHVLTVITFIGEPEGLVVLWGVLLIWFAWRKDWYTTGHWFALGLLAIGLTGVLKRLIVSPRPDSIFHIPSGYSFPSGHTALSIAFFGFIALLISDNVKPKLRLVSLVSAFLLVVVIAFSRLYIGAHWLTDIVGSILLGITVLLAVTISYQRKQPPKVNTNPMLLIALTTLILTTSALLFKDYKNTINDYLPHVTSQQIDFSRWWQNGLTTYYGQPLLRTNRLGYPVQTINVQWTGDLQNIKNQLLQQGWFDKPKLQLSTLVNYFGAQDRSVLMPLMHQVHDDQHPVLVMGKYIDKNKILLILRLWESNTTLIPAKYPLWIGTLNYRRLPQANLLSYIENRHKQLIRNYPAVSKVFPRLVSGVALKKLTYPEVKRLNNTEDLDWDGIVLLIQS